MDFKNKKVKVIKNNEIKLINQFKQRIAEDELGLFPVGADSMTYHKWLDCYEDWTEDYKKDFQGWQLENINDKVGCFLCKRCQERDYRNAHPNAKITGYNFNYYYENL